MIFLSGITINSLFIVSILILILLLGSFIFTKKLLKKTNLYKTKIKDKGDFIEFIYYLSIMILSLLMLVFVIYLVYLSFLYD